MKKMIKMLLVMVVVSFGFLSPIVIASEGPVALYGDSEAPLDEICEYADGQPVVCERLTNQTAESNVLVGANGVVTKLTKALVWISGTLAMILLIISGLMFIFSSGNSESAGRARRTAIYAVVGMVIAVVGQAIVSLVLNRL